MDNITLFVGIMTVYGTKRTFIKVDIKRNTYMNAFDQIMYSILYTFKNSVILMPHILLIIVCFYYLVCILL